MGKRKPANKEPEVQTSGTVKTLQKIADCFGVSRRTVQNWKQHTPPMPGKPRCWDLDAIRQWRETHLHQSKTRHTRGTDGRSIGEEGSEVVQLRMSLDRAKLEKELALAAQHQSKAKSLDEQWVQTESVREFVGAFLAEQRQRLSQIPVEMCAAYPVNIRRLILPDLIKRLQLHQNQMADWIVKVQGIKEMK